MGKQLIICKQLLQGDELMYYINNYFVLNKHCDTVLNTNILNRS